MNTDNLLNNVMSTFFNVMTTANKVLIAGVSAEVIECELGLVTQFILNGDDDIDVNLNNNYCHGCTWMETKATVGEDGVYRHPEDEPLEPLAMYMKDDKILLIYPYAITALIEDGEFTKWTRVD